MSNGEALASPFCMVVIALLCGLCALTFSA